MNEERPRKWERSKEWVNGNSVFLNFCMLLSMIFLTIIQTYQNSVALRNEAEHQRPRISFQMKLEKIGDPTRFRIVMPLEIGGTTDAQRVTIRTYSIFDQPGQFDYLSSIEVDWDSTKGQPVDDLSLTERGRRFLTPVISPTHMERIRSKEESYYFIGRLEYCDYQDNCYYFMKCAEVGDTGFFNDILYCGTRLGRLEGRVG